MVKWLILNLQRATIRVRIPGKNKNREEEINDLDLKAANQKSNNQLIDNSEID